jgi:hypothetical protein
VLVPADLTPDNSVLIKRLLELHAAVFDTTRAHIDVSVSNPSRILAVPGTLKLKGDNTTERPWRDVRLLHAGLEVQDIKGAGGERGIRTLDTGFSPYNGLANRRLQPLGHLSSTTYRLSVVYYRRFIAYPTYIR